MDILRRCYADESGQDIIEYSLLLVFVVLCSAALLFSDHHEQQPRFRQVDG